MLIMGFKLIDIKEYEYTNRVNVIDYFNEVNFNHILDLISLGNGKCSMEEASMILDDFLENDHTILDVIMELRKGLFGDNIDKEDDTEEESKNDIKKYKSLTDLYTYYCMQLMSIGLSYSEFWNMYVAEMFRTFSSIMIKLQNEQNRELRNYHTLAALVGSAVWGKLPKKPPEVEYIKNKEEENIDNIDDIQQIDMIAKLKSIVKMQNKRVAEGKD